MENIAKLAETYWVYLAPLSIGLLLLWFLKKSSSSRQRLRWMMEREELMRMHALRNKGKDDDTPSPVKQLLQRDDVSLRVLEEVYELPRYLYRRDWGSPDSLRLRSLESIQEELRDYLRSSVQGTDFPQIRDRVLGLLDQIKREKDDLQHKEPFNDIHDPEKSLLIDIFEEIDPGHTIVRQKAFQLANIIKIKHQDLLKLQAENAKAATWTKWGTAGTVVFGVLSLILSILTIKT